MKHLLALTITVLMAQICLSQTVIKMKKIKENLVMPCKIDGVVVSTAINLDESEAVISIQEVMYLLDNDQMEHIDILGNETAADSFFIDLRKVEFAGFTLYNIKALVLKKCLVPLTLGKSDMEQLGNTSISNGSVSIDKGNANFNYSSFKEPRHYNDQPQSDVFSVTEPVVNVNIFDKDKVPVKNLMAVITGQKKGGLYYGLVDNSGSLALQLPAGDTYDLAILGYCSYSKVLSFLDIPALKTATSRYTDPFIANIEYTTSKFTAPPNYFFEKNKYTIEDKQYKSLDSLVAYLIFKVNLKIELNGYTDSTETNQLILSTNRAKSIRDYLVLKNIDSNRITIKGHTFSRMPKDNGNITADLYRRIEIKLLDPFSKETFSAPIDDTAVVIYLTNDDAHDFTSSGRSDKDGKKQGLWQEYEVKNESFFRKRDNENPTQYEDRYLVYGEGNYIDNIKTGEWSFYLIEEHSHNKTLIKKVSFINDKENGPFKYFYADGNIAEIGNYANGNIEDSVKIYFEDHQIFARLLLKNNEMTGVEKYYYPDGTLKQSMHYKNGLKDGEEKSYSTTGVLEESSNYNTGKIDGAFRYYYSNGNIWTERIYDNDLLKKVTILVDKNGKDLDKGSFKNGNGVLHLYTEFGQVYLSVTFKDGKEISEE